METASPKEVFVNTISMMDDERLVMEKSKLKMLERALDALSVASIDYLGGNIEAVIRAEQIVDEVLTARWSAQKGEPDAKSVRRAHSNARQQRQAIR